MNSVEKILKNEFGETIIVQMSWLSEIAVIFIKHSDYSDDFIPINDYFANVITTIDEDMLVVNAIRDLKKNKKIYNK